MGFWASVGHAWSTVDTDLPVGRDAPFAMPGAHYADYSDNGIRVAVGWQRGVLGVEAGWVDFGSEVRMREPECNFPPGGQIICPAPGTFFHLIEQKGSATWVAFTPTYDAGSWTVGAKVGVARTRFEAARLESLFSHDDGFERSTRTTYGLAGSVAVTRNLSLRADFDVYHDRARTLGLSAMLRF